MDGASKRDFVSYILTLYCFIMISYNYYLFNLKLNPIEQVETLPLNPLNGFPWFSYCILMHQISTSQVDQFV